MRLILTVCAMLCFLAGFGKLTLNVDTVNFGAFREADGKKTVRAFVKNSGVEPVSILRTRSTCGCTVADHSDEVIMPGDSAWIDITYNPARRPGHFQKHIKVYDSENFTLVIPIEGTVIGTPETMSSAYPIEAGPLRLTEKTIMVPEIRHGDAKYLFINAYNVTDRNVTPTLESESVVIEPTIYPATVAPGEIGTLGFYLNTRKAASAGSVTYSVKLTPDSFREDIAPVIIDFIVNITE